MAASCVEATNVDANTPNPITFKFKGDGTFVYDLKLPHQVESIQLTSASDDPDITKDQMIAIFHDQQTKIAHVHIVDSHRVKQTDVGPPSDNSIPQTMYDKTKQHFLQTLSKTKETDKMNIKNGVWLTGGAIKDTKLYHGIKVSNSANTNCGRNDSNSFEDSKKSSDAERDLLELGVFMLSHNNNKLRLKKDGFKQWHRPTYDSVSKCELKSTKLELDTDSKTFEIIQKREIKHTRKKRIVETQEIKQIKEITKLNETSKKIHKKVIETEINNSSLSVCEIEEFQVIETKKIQNVDSASGANINNININTKIKDKNGIKQVTDNSDKNISSNSSSYSSSSSSSNGEGAGAAGVLLLPMAVPLLGALAGVGAAAGVAKLAKCDKDEENAVLVGAASTGFGGCAVGAVAACNAGLGATISTIATVSGGSTVAAVGICAAVPMGLAVAGGGAAYGIYKLYSKYTNNKPKKNDAVADDSA